MTERGLAGGGFQAERASCARYFICKTKWWELDDITGGWEEREAITFPSTGAPSQMTGRRQKAQLEKGQWREGDPVGVRGSHSLS